MIETSIQKIKNLLTQLAPRIIEFSLNEGVEDAEFDKLEQIIGKSIPSDFKELYRIYNGNNDEENMGNFFYGMVFNTIDELISEFNFKTNQKKCIEIIPLNYFDHQIDGSDFYNLNWIQIGNDYSRSSLLVDLAPSDTGTYGQVIFLEGTDNIGILVAKSIEELVSNFASDLEKGLYYLATDALEDGTHWLETTPGIYLDSIAYKKYRSFKNS